MCIFACLNVFNSQTFFRGDCMEKLLVKTESTDILKLQTTLFGANFAFFKRCILKYNCVQMGKSTVALQICIMLDFGLSFLFVFPLFCLCLCAALGIKCEWLSKKYTMLRSEKMLHDEQISLVEMKYSPTGKCASFVNPGGH